MVQMFELLSSAIIPYLEAALGQVYNLRSSKVSIGSRHAYNEQQDSGTCILIQISD